MQTDSIKTAIRNTLSNAGLGRGYAKQYLVRDEEGNRVTDWGSLEAATERVNSWQTIDCEVKRGCQPTAPTHTHYEFLVGEDEVVGQEHGITR
jgi:hypothetical protein